MAHHLRAGGPEADAGGIEGHDDRPLEERLPCGVVVAHGESLACQLDPVADGRPALHQAFLGTTGITPRWEVSNSDLDLAALQRRILSVARESHLLADHTKFGRTGLAIVSPLRAFTSVITDAHLTPALLAQLRRHVQKVLIAPS